MVLHPSGGALEKMLPPFRMGLGGQLGNGQQWMSWITRDDVVAVIRAAIQDEAMEGPVNATSPNPVRNAEFTRLLGAALHRPAVAAVPAFALELMFGELAREALLASQRPRNVSWLQAAGLLFGDWGTSRLYVLGLAFLFAGRTSFYLILAMSVLILAVGWAYTQICRIYPDGGGVYTAAKNRSQLLAVVGAPVLVAVRLRVNPPGRPVTRLVGLVRCTVSSRNRASRAVACNSPALVAGCQPR